MRTELRDWTQAIKRDVVALYIAGRDPRIPWYVKLAAMAVAAYALSPIDLIPDFIPVLGYLDDVIILPVAISPAPSWRSSARRRKGASPRPAEQPQF